MKISQLLIAIVMIGFCCMPATGHAVDGFVSFGGFSDQENVYSRPCGGEAEYKSEVEVGHRMPLFAGQIRPFVNFVTLMDNYNGDGNFHPASIHYTVGVGWEKPLTQRISFFAAAEHLCWHPIDAAGLVSQGNYFEFGFRF
jgi:hypothetical protein